METKEKNKIIHDLPFYVLIGMLGLSIAGVVIYLLWAIFFGWLSELINRVNKPWCFVVRVFYYKPWKKWEE